MKFSLSWLKDHLETSSSVADIAETLTKLGLEVEDVSNPAKQLMSFTVAEILEATQHPNADKLRVCKVNTGKEVLQIVCGAPNARAGIKVALASIGTVIPTNDLKIKQSKIRDIESNGMLCSARELGLGDDHAGIIELPNNALLGESIVTVLGLDDPIFEIAITPNRADCLGVYGIARDLAAAGLGALKPLPTPEYISTYKSDIQVLIEDKGCHEFVGCLLRGVKNQASPEWLQRKLKAIGLRPISALVDITNYFAYDLGRPLHVYDAKKLQGNLRIRSSKAGEKLHALNDKSYTLPDSAIAICDDSGVIGLGGIIGGRATGCDDNTTDVLLECAYFEPERIARTGRDLQILSDARYRFERGVDPAFLKQATYLAIAMIIELCGGEPSEIITAGHSKPWQRKLSYTPQYVNQLAGFDISAERQQSILHSLGFTIKDNIVIPPSWRDDVTGEADIAEEILRVNGYDTIPILSLPKPETLKSNHKTPAQQRVDIIRKSLAIRGLMESCTWSFLAKETAVLFGSSEPALALVNPISSELDTMRPNLLPNLIEAATRNIHRSHRNIALFEQGLQYSGIGADHQHMIAAGIRCGLAIPKNHFHSERSADIFDVKADALAAIEATGFDITQLQITSSAPAWYHPGRSGTFCLGKQNIAHFGEIHPLILTQLKAPERMVAFEIFIDAIPLPKRKATTRPAPYFSGFQPVERDFAFVVDHNLAANELLRSVKASEKTLIRSVHLFDLYQGKGLEAGKKSLALTVMLQANDRTLTDQEIEAVSQRIIASAAKLGATLRS